MTLILHTLSPTVLHLSSDYRLTNAQNLEPLEDQAGSKQISYQGFNWTVQIAFTGIANIGQYSTREHLTNIVAKAIDTMSVEDLASQICKVVDSGLKTLPRLTRFLTIMIISRELGKLRSIFISNFNLPDGRVLEVPSKSLEVFHLSNSKASYFLAGQSKAVNRQNRSILQDIAKSDREPHSVQELLWKINIDASEHPDYGSFISPGCYVHSLLLDGTSTGRNIGGTPGIPDMFIGGFNMGEWARKNLRPAAGEEIKLDGVSGKSFPKDAEDDK